MRAFLVVAALLLTACGPMYSWGQPPPQQDAAAADAGVDATTEVLP